MYNIPSILTFLLLTFPLLGQAQFSFQPNSDSSIFDTPVDTTAIFQYKLMISSGNGLFSNYLELTCNQDSTWSYSRVVISNIDDKRIELPPIDPPLYIDRLWQQLNHLEFLNLKTEKEINYIAIKDGIYLEIPFEKYHMFEGTDMSNYVSEFKSANGIRTIMHYSPAEMLKRINQSNMTWYVPDLYKASFCYTLIQDKFHFIDYRNAFMEYFLSIQEKKPIKKKRRLR